MPTTGAANDSHLPAVIGSAGDVDRVTRAILDFVGAIPPSHETAEATPAARIDQLTTAAARRAALTAGSLALPPGALGWFTVLPELVAIWKLQAQLVSDIAAVHGRHAELGREQMLYCLFRHAAAQAVRDLAVRIGDRLLFRPASQAVLEHVARQLGMRLGQRALGSGVSSWLPVIGAVGVGAYAWHDTTQVAQTADHVFTGNAAPAA